MLEEIRISGLGVIDEASLELGPGLTVITGETGAGKTMVVSALGLLFGARADAGAVRSGARAARVEGLIEVADEAAEMVENVGGDIEDGRVVLARTVSADGRSRGHVGGASTPVSSLAALRDPLLAVHGQSDQHRLLLPRAQIDALDRFAGLGDRLHGYGQTYRALMQVSAELAEVSSTARQRAQEADLLRFGVGEIESVGPQIGEEEELAATEARLGHADTLRRAAEQAREALTSDDGSPDGLGIVAGARTLLEGVRDHDPHAGALADRLAEVVYLLSDVAADIASYASSIDVDPAHLAAVSQRRSELVGLTRKYGDTIAEVLSWLEQSQTRLLSLDTTDEQIEALQAQVADLTSRAQHQALAISESRHAAAARLAKAVTAELATLAMPNARVQIEVSTGTDLGPNGLDEVSFTLAANTGSEPRPLAKGASGGELSRVMLALEVTLADSAPVPTMIFDEVDAGVGGAAAVEVGRRLAALGRHTQVIVVTHLPQVAAYADTHVLIGKSQEGSVTTSSLTVLDDDARERELSRMLAGLAESDTARAHARELLEVARASRA